MSRRMDPADGCDHGFEVFCSDPRGRSLDTYNIIYIYDICIYPPSSGCIAPFSFGGLQGFQQARLHLGRTPRLLLGHLHCRGWEAHISSRSQETRSRKLCEWQMGTTPGFDGLWNFPHGLMPQAGFCRRSRLTGISAVLSWQHGEDTLFSMETNERPFHSCPFPSFLGWNKGCHTEAILGVLPLRQA